MNYVKVENGQVADLGLPKTHTRTAPGFEGCTVSNFHTLDDEETYKSEGFYPLIDVQPEFDPETQYITLDRQDIDEAAKTVTAIYSVHEIPPPEEQPETPEEKIARLEAQVEQVKADNLTALEAIAEVYEMII